MNEVSIIINGVRYDAVKGECNCKYCDINDKCSYLQDKWDVDLLHLCVCEMPKHIFKKSDKNFEP